ncbi:MAG: U32 family peptidase [Rhodospirillum sp.]|nr:U32 family peptidase [Rhodospirillum sp.]MCF8491131.1 U32 family peptidase [Rhodospirillum sp.]MCF8501663.1 U32 family peptidase [Rhodospirillum sp.]
MDLTIGPIQFFWTGEHWLRFYKELAGDPSVTRVVLGEVVCSKRQPFFQTLLPEVVDLLGAAGKDVVLTTLALITHDRERSQTRDLFALGLEVEINDLSALSHVPEGTPFSVGPLVNVYNEGTLGWLAEKGARRVCLPPELPPDSITHLAAAGRDLGVAIEVWGYGRLPLAISARCYHARLHGRGKDACQFVCAEHPDGATVNTLDGTPFLAMNGVQTLSAAHANAARMVDDLVAKGVAALRLSPQTQDFDRIRTLFRDRLEGRIDEKAMLAAMPDLPYADGYLRGEAGASW